MPGEAVTLQLGHYAGCVGAQWWGLQAGPGGGPAELRSSTLLRSERAPGGRERLTPRLVALELKGGSVGPVAAAGPVAAGTGTAATSWKKALLKDEGAPTLRFQARLLPLRHSLLPRTPPRAAPSGSGPITSTFICIPRASTSSASTCTMGSVVVWKPSDKVRVCCRTPAAWRSWKIGCTFMWKNVIICRLAAWDELPFLSRRFLFGMKQNPGCCFGFTQGFQVLCDLHNGFSGVGAKVTELLYDEYSGKGILTWGLTPGTSNLGDSPKNLYRVMNVALGIVHLSRHSSLLCPLSLSGSLGLRPQPPVTFPYLNYDASLNFHSSAVLAAALDTLTVPYRLSSSQGSMMHLAETLNFSGRKVVAAWASLPFPARPGCSLADALCSHGQDVPWKLLVAWRERRLRSCFAQSVVLRGIGNESHVSSARTQPPSPLHACESAEQTLQRYLHTLFPGALSAAHVLEQPCRTLPPYPQFFSPLLTQQGFLRDKPPPSAAAVESIPVLAALQASPVLHTLLTSLYMDVKKLNARRFASFFSAGVEQDEFQEALEELRTLSQCYETELEGSESEDEEDSD